MHSVIEHLRSHAPTKAAFYRLVGRMPKGEYVLFPRDSHSVYGLGEAPRGLLPGLYQVFYFDATGQQIQHARVELNLTEAIASALGPVDGPSEFRSASGPAEAALPASKAQLSPPLPTGSTSSGSAQTDLVREQATHRMSMESGQQKHSFIQSSSYVREAGEVLMLNRMMRQEMIELNKQSQLQVQAAYGDVEKQVAALRLLRQAQKEVIQDLEALPRPPAPKPDLIPLAQELVNTIGALGTAWVQSRTGASAPQAAPAAAPPVQQGDTMQRPEQKERPASPPVPRRLISVSPPRAESAVPRIDFSNLTERPESD